jgi:hypothetical protein
MTQSVRPPAIVLVALLIFFTRSAAAHHPGPNPAPELPRSSIGLELEGADFAVQGGGHWRLAALSLEHTLWRIASVSARVPMAHVQLADGHGVFGPGDMDLGARVMAFQSYHEDFAIIVGLSFELPTGRIEDSLGGGHFMATPMAAVSYRMHRSFMLSLLASDHIPLDGDDDVEPPTNPEAHAQHKDDPPPGPSQTVTNDEPVDSAHGSVLAPHSDHEMRMMLIATYVGPTLDASIAGSVVVMFEEDHPLGPLTVEPELGARINDDTRVHFTLAVPVAGQRRLRWHGRLGVEYSF